MQLTYPICMVSVGYVRANFANLNMLKTLLMTTGVAWLALTGAAGAVTVTLKEGPSDPRYFAPEAAGQNNFTLGDITWALVSGAAGTAKGTTPGVSAAPLGMGTGPDGTTYMSVESGGTESATWATPQTSLSIYWGSIDGDAGGNDNLNSLAITVDGYTLTGKDLVALGALGTGNQSSPADNQWVTITGLGAFTQVSFSSTRNAFEFSLGTAVPEPSTWAMMLIGFAGLGYAGYRTSRRAAAQAA
jgi:PEP-CTERM motif